MAKNKSWAIRLRLSYVPPNRFSDALLSCPSPCRFPGEAPLGKEKKKMAYECATCDKTFSTSQYLESHCKIKRHSMNECRLCNRIFKDECALDQVMFYPSIRFPTIFILFPVTHFSASSIVVCTCVLSTVR